MFEDWYTDYLRMIYPRSPKEEIEYNCRKYHGKELIALAISVFNELKEEIEQLQKRNEKTEKKTNTGTFLNLIGLLGDIKTLHEYEDEFNECFLIKDIFGDFEKLTKKNQEESLLLFERQSRDSIKKYVKEWKTLALQQIVLKYSSDKIISYWHKETKEILFYDGSEGYSTFIKKIKNDKNIIPILDYSDYLNGLSYRYLLSRTIQLVDGYFSISQYKKEIKNIDDRLKALLVPDNTVLGDSAKKYFHKDYHWWYFGKPDGFYLDGCE
ncbi:hypothetical protein IQ249_20580 [Lusitaniella coriacea LEGE 07157]|uniref:Uncharacterized protein n=1 Tax=Lusitaniella coriacea LEGE 07157 TaxID=945747 RepID=A0A8J7IVQ9_9CYAN|nr:hypothetical protein [Lusitaniella coriacea]MBE9118292.1 hypothetical protein [Lusitaniella coriacea LEGE 07157]